MNKQDEYHNEFLNTADMLREGFMNQMASQGIDIEKKWGVDAESRQAESEIPMMRPRRNRDGKLVVDSSDNTNELVSEMGEMSVDALEKVIAIYPSISDSPLSSDLRRVIRILEKMHSLAGIEYKPFDPLRHTSGLKSKNPFDNAIKVVDNTVANYESHIVNDIGTSLKNDCPAVQVSIVGENNGFGFVARAVIAAHDDFTGSEAIDYVHAGKDKGIFTVKSSQKGRWIDVTDDFVIWQEVTASKLEIDDEFKYSTFVGEKIAAEGKEIISKNLKVSAKDIKFGKCQVFCRDASAAAKVRQIIKAKD